LWWAPTYAAATSTSRYPPPPPSISMRHSSPSCHQPSASAPLLPPPHQTRQPSLTSSPAASLPHPLPGGNGPPSSSHLKTMLLSARWRVSRRVLVRGLQWLTGTIPAQTFASRYQWPAASVSSTPTERISSPSSPSSSSSDTQMPSSHPSLPGTAASLWSSPSSLEATACLTTRLTCPFMFEANLNLNPLPKPST